MNTLYYGDNLKILREYIKDETVDLAFNLPVIEDDKQYSLARTLGNDKIKTSVAVSDEQNVG